jgi:hypothetical protein
MNRTNIPITTLVCCMMCSILLISIISAQSPSECPTCNYPSYSPSCICPIIPANNSYPVSCICPFPSLNSSASSCCSCPFGPSCTRTSRLQTRYLTVEFSANTTSGIAPFNVQFSDKSTGNPNRWLWDFGDGVTSTDQNPMHVYKNPGTYSVSLTVTRAYCSSTNSVTESRSITKTGFISVTGYQAGVQNFPGSEPISDKEISPLIESRKDEIARFLTSSFHPTPLSNIRPR